MSDPSPAHRVFAPAKINLYLHVLARRADGYHDIDSLLVFCDLGDWVEARPADDLTLRVEGPFADAIATENIVLRAARGLRDSVAVARGAALRLRKELPVAAGMGGGSSDAAAAIRALCRLWDLDPGAPAVAALAARLGADVPACLHARPVIVGGAGERILARPDLPVMALAVLNPGTALATAEIYRRCAPPPAMPMPAAAAPPARLSSLVPWLAERRNDLTAAARDLAPEIGEVLAFLESRRGCLLARMSGSGATCFGIFERPDLAAAAAAAAARRHPRWWARAAATSATGPPQGS